MTSETPNLHVSKNLNISKTKQDIEKLKTALRLVWKIGSTIFRRRGIRASGLSEQRIAFNCFIFHKNSPQGRKNTDLSQYSAFLTSSTIYILYILQKSVFVLYTLWQIIMEPFKA